MALKYTGIGVELVQLTPDVLLRAAATTKTRGRPRKNVSTPADNEVKAAMLKAFYDLGGVPALVIWGADNQTEFYKLWSKILPHEIREGIAAKAQPNKKNDNISVEFVSKNGATGARVTIGQPATTKAAGDNEDETKAFAPQLSSSSPVLMIDSHPTPKEIELVPANAETEDSGTIQLPL